MTRWVGVVHDLTLALLVGGIGFVGLLVPMLFEHAPSREIAGDLGTAIFDRAGTVVLGLAVIAFATGLTLSRAAGTTRGSGTSAASSLGPAAAGSSRGRLLPRFAIVLASAILMVAAFQELWLMPRLARLWETGAHAADGGGLIGEDRAAFIRLHVLGNVLYLSILAMAGVMLAGRSLRATR